jgi:hypothetical protein
MVTDLFLPQLAFRALSDAPDGDEDEVDAGSTDDEELKEEDDAEDDEDLAAAGFGVEEPSEEGAE